MGTNYYMLTKRKELAEKYFSNEYELVDCPYFGYEIHIGKRSCGWKPLFEQHKNAYDSVEGLVDFIKSHSKDICIIDEYSNEFTIEGLYEELITWGDNQKKQKLAYNGGKLTEDENGELDTPIDHIKYAELDRNCFNIHYWHDKDGYDFTDRSFS